MREGAGKNQMITSCPTDLVQPMKGQIFTVVHRRTVLFVADLIRYIPDGGDSRRFNPSMSRKLKPGV
jgi:hypothetical protein